jgi:outer membrane lipoprotein SlyB
MGCRHSAQQPDNTVATDNAALPPVTGAAIGGGSGASPNTAYGSSDGGI